MSGKTQSSGENSSKQTRQTSSTRIWRWARPPPHPRFWDTSVGRRYVFQQFANSSPIVIMMTTRVTIEATRKVDYEPKLFCRLISRAREGDRHGEKMAARNLDSRRSKRLRGRVQISRAHFLSCTYVEGVCFINLPTQLPLWLRWRRGWQ